MKTRHARALAILVLLIGHAACGSDPSGGGGNGGNGGDGTGASGSGGNGGGGVGLGQLDPRCESLCDDSDAACSADVVECQQECQVRVAGMSGLCATCLLEGSDGGTCGSGGTCCPNPSFPSSVLDCASSCSGSMGVNPSGDHPICIAICNSDDAACDADVTQCFQECRARIQGVSGICALCLLEDADGGVCGSGDLCCPDPNFPTSVEACAGACGG
jgi:hypothetical protein